MQLNKNKLIVDISIEDERWQELTIEPSSIIDKVFTIINLEAEEGFLKLTKLQKLQNSPYLSLDLCLTNDKEMQVINNNFRNIDKTTNVLTFSLFADDDNAIAIDDNDYIINLGEMIFAYEQIKKEAADNNLPFLSHFYRLIIHSCLHILGYTHDEDLDYEQMFNKEQQILELFGISNYFDKL